MSDRNQFYLIACVTILIILLVWLYSMSTPWYREYQLKQKELEIKAQWRQEKDYRLDSKNSVEILWNVKQNSELLLE